MPNKVPGILSPPPKTEIDGKVNFATKSIVELQEIYNRQIKLLNNQSFINKLPDKGEKINLFCEKVKKELASKIEENKTCELLSRLNIKSVTNDIEWNGNLGSNTVTYLDSDDDSESELVFDILTKNTKKPMKHKIMEISRIITEKDLEEIQQSPHNKYIIKKTEVIPKPKPDKFRPYKTTITNVHDPSKELSRRKPFKWEITAATPPPIIHGVVKTLSIGESLKLQQHYESHLKEVQAKHAAEKLTEQYNFKIGDVGSLIKESYREQSHDSDVSEPESAEEYFEEDEDRGGVVFPVSS